MAKVEHPDGFAGQEVLARRLRAKAGDVVGSMSDARRIVSALADVISDTLAEGRSIRLMGFGQLKLVDQGPSVGRVPADWNNRKKTKPVPIPGRRVIYFKAHQNLKDAINKGVWR